MSDVVLHAVTKLVTIYCISLLILSQSAEARTKVRFNLGASMGGFLIDSPSLDIINSRLGNSARLFQPYSHKIIDSTTIWGNLTHKNNFWHIDFSYTQLTDTLTANNITPGSVELTSKINASIVKVDFGFRLFPYPTRRWSRGAVGNKFYGFQIYGLAGVGVFDMLHDYKYIDPLEDIDMQYKLGMVHMVYTGTVRISWYLSKNIDLILDYVAGATQFQSRSLNLKSLTVEGQDQRFKYTELELDTLGEDPFTLLGGKLGVRWLINE